MLKKMISFVAVAGLVFALAVETKASTILPGLLGGDLTDIGDNGVEASYAPPTLAGFDAEFFANDKPGFGGTKDAFNVFDNINDRDVDPNYKWTATVGSGGFPKIVGAHKFTSIAGPIELTHFTLTSAHDIPDRDPRVWSIQGSNDTTTGLNGSWTTIYARSTTGSSDWTGRYQTLRYSPADGDTFLTTESFTAFRMVTTATGLSAPGPPLFFQISEIEFFGVPVPEPATMALLLLGVPFVGLFAWRKRKRKR